MNYPNLTFNGTRKAYLGVLEKKRPYWAPRNRQFLTIPGKPGGYLSDTTVDVLKIPVTFLVTAETPNMLSETVEDFIKWLSVDAPAPLKFDDQPGTTYYAIADGEIVPEEFVTWAKVQVTFAVPDSYRYAEEKTVPFTGELMEIVNDGQADAQPIFTATVNGNITNLDIVTEGAYMRLGAPAPVSYTPIDPRTLLTANEFSTTNGWATATSVDNGQVTGTMTSEGNGLIASTWGTPITPAGWQGPSLIQSLPEPVQDFTAAFLVENMNGFREAGMIEVYFRDTAGNLVAKMGLEDVMTNASVIQAKLQLGTLDTRKDLYRGARYAYGWNDFDGIIQFTRSGNKFTMYVGKIRASDGLRHTRDHLVLRDYEGIYQTPIAQVQVAIRKYSDGTIPATAMKIKRMDVWRHNDTSPVEPNYIAQAGDILTVDHTNGSILVNGEHRLFLKDMGSKFFGLKPGTNHISYSPAHLVDLSVKFRERR